MNGAAHGELAHLFRHVVRLLMRGHEGPAHPGQARILRILKEQGPLNRRMLMDLLGVRSASLSEILAKLERQDCIAREQDAGDRRGFIISLTDKGNAMTQAQQDTAHEAREDIFACLTEEEKEALAAILHKIAGQAHACEGQGRMRHGRRHVGHGRHCPGGGGHGMGHGRHGPQGCGMGHSHHCPEGGGHGMGHDRHGPEGCGHGTSHGHHCSEGGRHGMGHEPGHEGGPGRAACRRDREDMTEPRGRGHEPSLHPERDVEPDKEADMS